MSNAIKKLLGIGCALFGSTLLVLSLVGVVGPGCGGGGKEAECQTACNNYFAKCGAEKGFRGSGAEECMNSCLSVGRSGSGSGEGVAFTFVCIAKAPSCDYIDDQCID